MGADGERGRARSTRSATRRGPRRGPRAPATDAVAVALLHGYRYPEHERRVAQLARAAGFSQVSVSHEISPLMKLVSRGETTVVDAYLSPILRRYVDGVAAAGRRAGTAAAAAARGPALHAVARRAHRRAPLPRQGQHPLRAGRRHRRRRARRAARAGFERLVTFDMGGTSTDVAHYAGEYERSYESVVGGVRLRAPDAAHPHGRRRRRVGVRLRGRALPGRARAAPAPTRARPATARAGRSP